MESIYFPSDISIDIKMTIPFHKLLFLSELQYLSLDVDILMKNFTFDEKLQSLILDIQMNN